MGKPAARLGDMTAHGGSIVVGLPTVLIGGMPAARVGDMHVCPMLNPGVPPPPHVGGPIMMGSPMVLIGGMPAARMGDMVTCAGPPDTIMLGCMTVLIGEGGSGSAAGGGAGGGAGATVAGANASAKLAGPGPLAKPLDTHFLDVTFVDKASLPVGGVMYSLKAPDNSLTRGYLSGRISRRGVQKGNYEFTLRGIVNARWSMKTANVGDNVDLIVDTIGVDSGAKVELSIFVKDANYTDHRLQTLETTIKGTSAKAQWKMEVDEKYLRLCGKKESYGRYSRPFFYFVVEVEDLYERSDLLELQDWIEIKAVLPDGSPAKGEEYILRLPNGEIRKGKLDQSGAAKVKGVYPSICRIEFPRRPDMIPQ